MLLGEINEHGYTRKALPLSVSRKDRRLDRESLRLIDPAPSVILSPVPLTSVYQTIPLGSLTRRPEEIAALKIINHLSLILFLATIAGAEEIPRDKTVLAIPGTVRFNRDVLPILSDHCFKCHGPDEHQRETKQRFDIRAGVERATSKGILVPGKPNESKLIMRLTTNDEDEVMPPPSQKSRPSPGEIAILRRWIEQGAKVAGPLGLCRADTPEASLRWFARQAGKSCRSFYRAQASASQNRVRAPRWACCPAAQGLAWISPAYRPSPAEREKFLSAMKKPGAWERLVERLLASPRYGERLALYWLDLVRYADSVGYQKDSHQNIWLYRDYVIAAFNNNKPFDRFVREQLAGDLMKDPNGSAAQVAEWRIASGFNRLNQTTSEGGAQAEGIHGQVCRRPGPQYQCHLPGHDDRLRRMPRPQIRPHH